jgi:hypothetical protein
MDNPLTSAHAVLERASALHFALSTAAPVVVYPTGNFIFKPFDVSESFRILVIAHHENRLCYTEFSWAT